MATVATIQKTRTDSVTGERLPGPVHVLHQHNQTWCGRKMLGFGITWRMNGNTDDVTCKTCLTALANNQPRSWRRR